MSTLLLTPKAFREEALSSLLQRVAQDNYLSSHELWRYVTNVGARYPQTNIAASIDYVSSSVVEVEILSKILNICVSDIRQLSFEPVARMFLPAKLTDKEVLETRLLSGLISNTRKFCPRCLAENPFYKIIWQVSELEYCPKHMVTLMHKCPNCGKDILLFSPRSVVGRCDKCLFQLQNAQPQPVELKAADIRFLEDWKYLFSSDKPKAQVLNDKNIIALKLVFLLNDCKEKLDKSLVKRHLNGHLTVNGLLQAARNSRRLQSYTHLGTILTVLRILGVSVKEFLVLNVPTEFIESVYSKQVAIKEKYSCKAPWCKSYNKPGSLVRTHTSKKEKQDGSVWHYYLYCNCCSVEYAIDKQRNTLIQRSDFIDFAWGRVKPRILNGESIKKIARELNVSQDKIKRSVIFLYANGALKKDYLSFYLPEKINTEKIEKLITDILANKKAKDLCKEFEGSYEEFLYYWSLPEVRSAKINQVIPKNTNKENEAEKNILVGDALEYFINTDKKITIASISNYLGVCSETLRLWGALPLVAQAKDKQRINLLKQGNHKILNEAQLIIELSRQKGERISSSLLYKQLGVNPRVLVRNSPEVTKQITLLLKKF